MLDFVEFLLDKHQLFRRSPAARSKYDENDVNEGSQVGITTTQDGESRILGLNRGDVWMSDDFNEPLPDDFWLGKS